MNRQAGRLDVTGTGHPQRLRLGVHRADKRVVAARIMVRQAGGGAVFRRHQRQQQHIAAADLAVQAHARIDPFHLRRLADINGQHFIKRQMGVKHHHRGHHLRDRRHRANQIRLAGIDDFFAGKIDDHRAAGSDIRLGGGHRRGSFSHRLGRKRHSQQQRQAEQRNSKFGHREHSEKYFCTL